LCGRLSGSRPTEVYLQPGQGVTPGQDGLGETVSKLKFVGGGFSRDQHDHLFGVVP